MKRTITTLMMAGFLGASCFGAHATTGKTTSAPQKTAPVAVAKLSKKEAKKECLSKNPELKGKDLEKCIAEKMNG